MNKVEDEWVLIVENYRVFEDMSFVSRDAERQ